MLPALGLALGACTIPVASDLDEAAANRVVAALDPKAGVSLVVWR